MAIRSFMMFLGVTAMFWCALDALTLSNCATDSSVVRMTALSISGNGKIPVFGGTRTVSGTMSVSIDSSSSGQISQVSARLPSATVTNIPVIGTKNLCDVDHSLVKELCSTNGKTLTCSEFNSFFALNSNSLCDGSGNFQNPSAPLGFSESITIPNALDSLGITGFARTLLSSMSISATGSAEAHLKVEGSRIGCISIQIAVSS